MKVTVILDTEYKYFRIGDIVANVLTGAIFSLKNEVHVKLARESEFVYKVDCVDCIDKTL